MLDLRELIASLDDEDRRLWTLHRTEMRRSYMTAHNSVLGIGTWTEYDDQFLDLIDIKLALLFDKSGRMLRKSIDQKIVATEDSEHIEADLETSLAALKAKSNGVAKPEQSEASKTIAEPIPVDGWGSSVQAGVGK